MLKLLFAVALASHSAFAQQDTSWSKLYRRDLDSLRATIAADHPGALDRENPAFAQTLTTAYQQALAAQPTVSTYDAYRYHLARFINAFQDEHLAVGFKRPFTDIRYAGIDVAFRAGSFVVISSDSAKYDVALSGAALVSCDGSSAANVFEQRVLSWRGRASIEADWYKLAPLFFVDYGRPTPAPPQVCRFVKAGKPLVVRPIWSGITPEALSQQLRNNEFHGSIALRRLQNDQVVWLNLPTFAVNQEPELSRMRALVDSAARLRGSNWQLLVLDLRGNSGGSSTWGDEFARALFGEEWLAQAKGWIYDGVYTEWRVSAGNVANNREIVKQIANRDGATSRSATSFGEFVDSMAAALARGAQYIGTRQVRSNAPRPAPTQMPGKIVVIAGATCFSACLDFLDRFRLHPQVVQVGQTTGVDTNYMENWGGPISDLVSLGHPMKVYRNRRRANNEAYKPHVAYTGDLYDTAALETLILGHFH